MYLSRTDHFLGLQQLLLNTFRKEDSCCSIILLSSLSRLCFPSIGETIMGESVKQTMRAVIFKGVGEVAVEDRPIPTIQDPRDAIVKVTASGLCGSDMHWYRGHAENRTGFIPGHEVVGIIHEIGSAVTGFQIGDHVVVGGCCLIDPTSNNGS